MTGADIEALKADPERDAFEEWYCVDAYETGGPSFISADIAAMREGDLYGAGRTALNAKWYGWKARATAAEASNTELIAQRAALVGLAKSDNSVLASIALCIEHGEDIGADLKAAVVAAYATNNEALRALLSTTPEA